MVAKKKKSIRKPAVKKTKKKSTKKSTKKSPKKTTKKKSSKVSSKSKSSSAKTKLSSSISPKSGGGSKEAGKSKKKNYSLIDKEIFALLEKQPKHQLILTDIETILELSLEEVKKAIKRMENKNPPKINAKLVMDASRWVTQITKVEDYGSSSKSKKKSNKLVWKTENDLPCFICPYISKCSLGQLQYNPKICPFMTLWLQTSIKGEKYTENPFHPKFIDKKSAKAKEAAKKA